MRILIATDTSLTFVCGGTRFIERAAARFVKRGHEVLIMCPSRTFSTEHYEIEGGVHVCGIASVPTFVQKNLRVVLPFGIQSSIEEELRAFAPDVIHLQSHFALASALWRAAKKAGVPTIETNHVMPENFFSYFHFPLWLERRLTAFGWRQLHRILGQLDAVTTPTETAARYLRDSGFAKPVYPVSNGIDLQSFSPGPADAALREKYSLPDKPLLLYVGRLDPEKNLDDLLAALPIVLKKAQAHLVIVGRGARAEHLRQLAVKLGVQEHVTFTSFVENDDLPGIYRLATCFLMPGTAELQSIVTMEAMATELPVVAADAMALPELVHSGENGYLYPARNVEALATAVIKILSDQTLRVQMSAASLAIVRPHDLDATVARYLEIYRAAQEKHAH